MAIKLLAGRTTDAARGRLFHEARAAAGLSHPHICTVFEVGEANGETFIVMEYVEGRALRDLIPPAGLPLESVLRFGAQIGGALAHAHDHGVVHRDLKPANVVMTPDGRAKVLDFGVAARRQDGDPAERVQVQQRVEDDPVTLRDGPWAAQNSSK